MLPDQEQVPEDDVIASIFEDSNITTMVTASNDGMRIDRVISMLSGCSRARAATEIDLGRVFVDGSRALARSLKLHANEQISFPRYLLDAIEQVELKPDHQVQLNVVYEDQQIIVINKDSNTVVHPGIGIETGTLVSGLLDRYPEIKGIGDPTRPGIVHRLDRQTSGLMVVARDDIGYRSLSRQMKAHSATRNYIALVHGFVEPNAATLEGPIAKSRKGIAKMEVSSEGKFARTKYKCIASLRYQEKEYSLIILALDTGRTHQIRVHMSAHGNAVVGDQTYGSRFQFGSRIALHAYRLSVEHPASQERMTFYAGVPEDICSLIADMEVASGNPDVFDLEKLTF